MPYLEADTTRFIVASILSIYSNIGDHMYLRFEDNVMSLLSLFSNVIPCVGDMTWPVDKEELARVWHYIYRIHDRVSGLTLEFALPQQAAGPLTDEILLHPKDMLHTLSKVTRRAIPNMDYVNVDPFSGLQYAPTSEIRISTFDATWFLSTEFYVKRVRVFREASLLTLFIVKSAVANGLTRYHLTWFPRAHLKPTAIHKRSADSWTSAPIHPWRLHKKGRQRKAQPVELKALVWNVRRSAYTSVLSNLFVLLDREKPMLVIVTGTDAFNHMSLKLTKTLGYTRVVVEPSEEEKFNGFWVLWNPKQLHVQELRSFENTKHLRVKVLPAKGRTREHKITRLVSRIPGCKA